MTTENCHVCGSPGARLHYKGVLCGRCRVFFIRCAKEQPLTCIGNKDCPITTAKRANCAYCRFKRCCELKMDIAKVGKQKAYKTKVFYIQAGFIRYFMKVHHPALLSKTPVITPASLETIVLLHQKSLNLDGPSPSFSAANINVPLSNVLEDPTVCTTRDTACFDQLTGPKGFDPKIQYNLQKSFCRWIVSFADFLRSTHFFDQFSARDSDILAQRGAPEFFFMTRLQVELEKRNSLESLNSHVRRFYTHESVLNSALTRFTKGFVSFIETTMDPLREEMHFDDFELCALKVIAMFSIPPNLSEDGVKKANLAREAFTRQLADYISETYPELSKSAQLLRLRKLLELLRNIKEASQPIAQTFTNMVLLDFCQLSGRLTYDLHVREM